MQPSYLSARLTQAVVKQARRNKERQPCDDDAESDILARRDHGEDDDARDDY